MNESIIASDNPLTAEQKAILNGLLDVIIPPDEKRGLPGASTLELIAYLDEQAPELISFLAGCLDYFDSQFAGLSYEEQHPLVESFSQTHAEFFNGLLFHTFACYYQNNQVLKAIGLDSSPPFPRGNDVASGDLSLLDPVLKRPRVYRLVSSGD